MDRAAGDNELRELAVLLSLAVVDGAVGVGTVTAKKRRENKKEKKRREERREVRRRRCKNKRR